MSFFSHTHTFLLELGSDRGRLARHTDGDADVVHFTATERVPGAQLARLDLEGRLPVLLLAGTQHGAAASGDEHVGEETRVLGTPLGAGEVRVLLLAQEGQDGVGQRGDVRGREVVRQAVRLRRLSAYSAQNRFLWALEREGKRRPTRCSGQCQTALG